MIQLVHSKFLPDPDILSNSNKAKCKKQNHLNTQVGIKNICSASRWFPPDDVASFTSYLYHLQRQFIWESVATPQYPMTSKGFFILSQF